MSGDGRLRVVHLPGGSIDPELLEDLRHALNRLPPALRSFPGGPLELVLHSEPAPFGMGDGSSEKPDWTEGRRRFHLYRAVASTERRAERALAGLSPRDRGRLWRQRAVVHAVMQRWDDALRLSARPAWRRIAGWRGPFEGPFTWREHALNVYSGAFSRERGRLSASLDLVTFAEEHFVPPEAFTDAIATDDTVPCRELSRSRVLRTLLHEAGLAEAYAPPPCPAFDRWARPQELSHFEVLLVAASGRRSESLFGHLLLRPVYHAGELVQGPGLQTAVEIAAITEGAEAGPRHLVRGIAGGYRMTVFTLAMADLGREALESEQRTIRRFRLNLSEARHRRLFERIWEFERRGYFEYRFFTENCATALVFLLEGALDEHQRISLPGWLLVSPTSALDGLAEAVLEVETDAGPIRTALLTLVPEPFESSRELAERSERQRVEVEEAILAELPRSERPRLAELFAQARSPDAARRAAAFEALASRSDAEGFYDWWALTVRIERYFRDRAVQEWTAADLTTIDRTKWPPPDADEAVRARQRQFERESELARAQWALDRAEHQRLKLERAPRRRLRPDELKLRTAAEQAEHTFDRVTALHGEVIDDRFPNADPHAWLERDRERLRQEQRRWSLDALAASGTWRAGMLAGGRLEGSKRSPVVRLETAALLERLGDQRLRGFQPSSELHVLEASVELEPRLGLPLSREGHLVVFAYRSVARELPMFRRTTLDHFGWGMGAGSRWNAEEQRQSTTIHGELLAILDEGPRWARHAIAGLGLETSLAFTPSGLEPLVGPRLTLAQRVPLPGHSANALRLEASLVPNLGLRAARWFRRDEARAAIDCEVVIGPVLAALRVEADAVRETGSGWTPRGLVGVKIEPL